MQSPCERAWHTFAGGAVNRLLAAGLEAKSGHRWVAGNLSIRCKEVALAAANQSLQALRELDWERIATAAARDMARGLLTKFQPCLPEEAEDRLLAERLLDLPGALRFLHGVTLGGVRVALQATGARIDDVETSISVPPTPTVRRGVSKTATPLNEIDWVDTADSLRDLTERLLECDVIGLDVETAMDLGTLCLVQIATRQRTYLIDPFAVEDLTPLALLLNRPTPLKVIHNARFEQRVLAKEGIVLDGVYDTMEESRRLRGTDALGGHSLAIVCERELDLTVDKSAQTSNWGRRPLEADQLQYAALDAEVLVRLHDHFSGTHHCLC
jgi:ATP-dependent Lhr-like helicase